MRDYLESLWYNFSFSLQIWCDQLDAETEAVLVVAVLVAGLAAVTWIYFV